MMMGVIAVLVLAVLGLGATLLLKAGKGDSNKLIAAPANTNNSGLLQAPAEATHVAPVQAPKEAQATPVVQQPDNVQPFPADIDDYLKFLKRIEAKKQTIIRSQTADALLMMTKAKGLSTSIEDEDYNKAFKDIGSSNQKGAQEWNALTQEFNGRQPPPACVDLRNKFLDQLGKIQASIAAVNDALARVQSDPSNAIHDLTKMQGGTSAEVDAAIDAADSALAEVCDKYRLKKDFDIRGDSGSGNLLR